MAAAEFLERDVVAAPLQLRHDRPAAAVDRKNLSAVPCEMKTRGLPCGVPSTTKPGEKATTRRNRSPLTRPSESAYVAPSENPPTAIRAGSTDTVSNTRASARSMNATSGPKPSRMASHVESRESGARTATPASSAARRRGEVRLRRSRRRRASMTNSGSAGRWSSLAAGGSRPRLRSRPSARDLSRMWRRRRAGRAVSLPSFACDGSLFDLARVPNANDVERAARHRPESTSTGAHATASDF